MENCKREDVEDPQNGNYLLLQFTNANLVTFRFFGVSRYESKALAGVEVC